MEIIAAIYALALFGAVGVLVFCFLGMLAGSR